MKTIAVSGSIQLIQYSDDFICMDHVTRSLGMTLEVFDNVSSAFAAFHEKIKGVDKVEYLYKVVSEKNDRFEIERFQTVQELLNKYEMIGIVNNDYNRKELQGKPKLKGYHGAMYDGIENGKHVIRYETSKAYAALSN